MNNYSVMTMDELKGNQMVYLKGFYISWTRSDTERMERIAVKIDAITDEILKRKQ